MHSTLASNAESGFAPSGYPRAQFDIDLVYRFYGCFASHECYSDLACFEMYRQNRWNHCMFLSFPKREIASKRTGASI